MPRIARIVIPGCPHHVTQRGNNRQDVFFCDDDRRFYLATLKAQAERFGLSVHGYCLMTNHVHLVATPAGEESLARAVGRTHWLHARRVNDLHGRSGHLWQARFHSCGLDEKHLILALRYVERNPVRAGLVRKAWRYPWSSAAAHAGKGADRAGLLDLARWHETWSAEIWEEWLTGDPPAQEQERLRRAAQRGRPLGSDDFLADVEARLGHRLRPLPVGRPRKQRSPK